MKTQVIVPALVLAFCTLGLGSCRAPETSAPQQATPLAIATPRAFLVFERGTSETWRSLDAIGIDGASHRVLREKFVVARPWNISRDGQKIVFAAKPGEVKRAPITSLNRTFPKPPYPPAEVFLLAFDSKPVVVSVPHTAKGERDDYEPTAATWNANATKILYTENSFIKMGFWFSESHLDASGAQWLSLFDLKTNRKIWNSRKMQKDLQDKDPQDYSHLLGKRFHAMAMSPDSRHVVALVQSWPSEPWNALEGKDYTMSLLHFDLNRNKLEVLWRFNTNKVNYGMGALSWHPDSTRFLFSLGVRAKKPDQSIYLGNWKTRNIQRLTHSGALESDPVWIDGGRQIAFLSNRLAATKPNQLIFAMNADGSNPRQILKNLRDVSNLRHVETLPDWSKFKNLDTTPRAAVKK